MLAFFFDSPCCPNGIYDHRDVEGFRLFWFPDGTPLARQPAPPNVPPVPCDKRKFILREQSIIFREGWSLPEGESLQADAMAKAGLATAAAQVMELIQPRLQSRTRLGGYGATKQGCDVTADCGFRSEGNFDVPGSPHGFERLGPALPHSEGPWRLVLQFDFSADGKNACGYEDTVLYLRKRRFDRKPKLFGGLVDVGSGLSTQGSERMSMKRDELTEHLRNTFGKPAADAVMRFALPMAQIAMEDLDGEDIPVGSSKYGGSPDLPEGTPWPMATAILPHKPVGHTYPLTFVAQINFAEATPFLGNDPTWPREGLLSFFYDAVCRPVGDHDRREAEGFRLIWSSSERVPAAAAPASFGAKLKAMFGMSAAPSAPPSAPSAGSLVLKRTTTPAGTAPSDGDAAKFVLEERKITFSSATWTLVNGEGTESDAMGLLPQEPLEWWAETFPMGNGPRHRLGGHAQAEQGDPIDECAERSRFLRTGAAMRPMGEIMIGHPKMPDPATRWRLLFQFDFSEDPDIACGYEHTQFYVCISDASIRNRRFDEAAWTWDSD